jgi:glycosyltransferase involved in cell wall biosynthesis
MMRISQPVPESVFGTGFFIGLKALIHVRSKKLFIRWQMNLEHGSRSGMGTRKLAIWVMTDEYPPDMIGGLGVVAHQLTERFRQAGHELFVLGTGRTKHLEIRQEVSGVKIAKVPGKVPKYRKDRYCFEPKAVLGELKDDFGKVPDLVHVHSPEYVGIAEILSSHHQVPIVYTCHSLTSGRKYVLKAKKQARLLRLANRIAVPSKWMASRIKRKFPGLEGKIVVIPNGIDVVNQPSHEQGSPYQLLYAGRIAPLKGIASLIRAFARLNRRNKQASLTIIGSGRPAFEKKMRLLARKLRVNHRIRWIPRVTHEEMQGMYHQYGAVIVPSRLESFCLVALEAMANEIPLVATQAGGLKTFVDDSNAAIIKSCTPTGIVHAVRQMWQNRQLTAERLVKARETANRYQWSDIVQQYLDLFGQLTASVPEVQEEKES